MPNERNGIIKFQGNPLTLLGPELKIGDRAPEFELVNTDLSLVKLSNSAGKVRILSVVPSVDTPVCDQQTRKFNELATTLHNTEVITISMDLPFAFARWCAGAGVDKLKTLSDYRGAKFGTDYGVLIKELYLDTRAVFVIDGDGIIKYIEIVSEVTALPNFDKALSIAKSL
jgi:thioredoxin-dependent peroxiredoxin